MVLYSVYSPLGCIFYFFALHSFPIEQAGAIIRNTNIFTNIIKIFYFYFIFLSKTALFLNYTDRTINCGEMLQQML
jgi:hypothetical protein